MSEIFIEEPTEQQPNWLAKPLAKTLSGDWEKWIYAIFIVLALITRLHDLGSRVVSHDESLHTQYSYQYFNGEGYEHTPLMHGPFLFHVTAASYWLFGHNDFTSRIPVAIFGVLLVAMPYFLREWIGKKGAIFASFVFLISPYVTYYSRYIRHDIYIIVWAMIVFIATMYYLRDPQDKYLWWFAGGVAMMFATKEVSFIYVAIFGSFLIFRLLGRAWVQPWFREGLPKLAMPSILALVGIVIVAGGLLGVRSLEGDDAGEVSAEFQEDPNLAPDTTEPSAALNIAHGAQVFGFFLFGFALFLMVKALREDLDKMPEYDLIMLYAALLLPSLSALMITMAGFDPLDTTRNACNIVGGEGMTAFRQFTTKFTQGDCWSAFFTSPTIIVGLFTIALFGISILVGVWWNQRKFVPAVIIFYALFLVFYSSFFTNTVNGLGSGIVGSLGYWLVQQEVARGGQPWFYYMFVVPFYEFMPVIFSFFAIRLWLKGRNLHAHAGHWVSVIVGMLLAYRLVNWLLMRTAMPQPLSTRTLVLLVLVICALITFKLWRGVQAEASAAFASFDWLTSLGLVILLLIAVAHLPVNGINRDELSRLPGMIAAMLIFLAGVLYWFAVPRRTMLLAQDGVSWHERLDPEELFGFVPHVIWWLFMTWVAYSYAGEKMPWLSTHFVIPMALLVGWYFEQKLRKVTWGEFTQQRSLALLGLAVVIPLVAFLALKGLLLDVQWGDKTADNLSNIGTVFGRILILVLIAVPFVYLARGATQATIRRSWLLGGFILLSALTVRFNYLASFVNFDYTNEFIVYAHGAPATKSQVLSQLEEISMRLYGDKSVKVGFDSDASWPYYWYLREYDNRVFFGEDPGGDILDAPVLIVGDDQWSKVDAIVREEYVHDTYTYLWWPMEEYRNISLDGIFGVNGSAENPRGLANQGVRQAMWDIFFYRDYEQYGEVFGGTYTAGEWPLRDSLRIYIRRDVLGKLWDQGVAGTQYTPPEDPYAEGEYDVMAVQQFGSQGAGDGQLERPRNAAVGPDGRVFVADTGNHRIQVFNPDGSFGYTIGTFGAEPGQFNEPWGISADNEYIYVADTWNNRIQKLTFDGEFVLQVGLFGQPDGNGGELLFYGPRDVSLSGDNEMLVTDTGNHRVQRLDRDGNFLGQVGVQGFALGEFSEPTSLTVGQDGTVYVAEAWSERIQQLSADLLPAGEWPINAWDGNSIENKPYMTIDSQGRLYATDPEGYQVLVFNTFGEYLGRFGRYGTDFAGFNLPTGVTVDANDNVYVIDTNNNRVLKFDPIPLNP